VEDFSLAIQPGSIEGMRVAHPDTKQLPAFMLPDVIKSGRPRPDLREPGRTVEAVRCPTGISTCRGRPGHHRLGGLRAASRLHREPRHGDRPRRAHARHRPAKSFLPGAYAEGTAHHGRAPAGVLRLGQALRCDPPADHGGAGDPAREVDETSPIPGYLTRPANYLGLLQPRLRPASRRTADRHPDRRQPFAERDVLRLGKAFQDAYD